MPQGKKRNNAQKATVRSTRARGAKSTDTAAGSHGTSSTPPSFTMNVNKLDVACHNIAIYDSIQADIDLILTFDNLGDIFGAEPLKIKKDTTGTDSGHAAIFNPKDAKTSLQSTGIYDSSINYFWQDWQWSTKKKVPIVSRIVDEYVSQTWPIPGADPGVLPFRIDNIVASADEDLPAQISTNSMKSITEPQLRLAPIRACARDLRAGFTDESHQLKWRRLFLTASGRIIVANNAKDWVFKGIIINIELGNQHNCAVPSALQKIMEIGDHKDRMEANGGRESAKTVALDYNKNIKIGSGSEDMEMSESAVDAALTVKSRAFSNPRIYNIAMLDLEYHGKRCLWDTILKFQIHVTKTSSDEAMLFSFEFLFDLYHQQIIGPQSWRELHGDSKTAKKGLVEVANWMFSFKTEILETWIPSLQINFDCMSALRKALSDPVIHRTYMGPADGSNPPLDQSWRAPLCVVGNVLMDHLSDMLFTLQHYNTISDCLKRRLSPSEVLTDKKMFTAFFEAVDDALAASGKQKLTDAARRAAEQKLETEQAQNTEAAVADPTGVIAILKGNQTQIDIVKNLNDEQTTVLIAKKTKARTAVFTFMHLIAEDRKSEAQLIAAVQVSPAGKFKPSLNDKGGQGTQCVGFWHDLKQKGESSTCPKHRQPPFVLDDAKRGVKIACGIYDDGSGKPLKLDDGIVHFWFLGSKGVQTQVRNVYVDENHQTDDGNIVKIAHHCKDMQITYHEDSLLERRASVQGNQLNQNEPVLVLTRDPLEVGVHVPKVNRTEYQGSNLGNNVGLVNYVKWSESWQVTFSKKKIYYARKRQDVGGKSADVQKRVDEDYEPFSYHVLPSSFLDTMMVEHCISASVDFNAASGVLGLLHVTKQKHYTGFCFTEAHKDALYEWAVEEHFRAMLDPDSTCKDEGLMKLLSKTGKSSKPLKGGKSDPKASAIVNVVDPSVSSASKKKAAKTDKDPATQTGPSGDVNKSKKDLLDLLANLKNKKGEDDDDGVNIIGADDASDDDDEEDPE